MAVNLFAAIPSQHPGARASDFFSGSLASVGWAIAEGSLALAVHALLGLALVVAALAVAVEGVRSGERTLALWSSLAALSVIGAGFNGASFLDYGHNVSSLIMALLAFAAIGCYLALIYLTGEPAGSAGHLRE